MSNKKIFLIVGGLLWLCPSVALASEGGEHGHGNVMKAILGLTIMFLVSQVGALVKRFNQPAVLGQLILGVAFGALSLVKTMGVGDYIVFLRSSETVLVFAEFGVLLLLFKAGLEENLQEMKKVGLRAFAVAIIGVVLPAVGGAASSYFLLPEESMLTHVFIGCTFVATSVGITAAVFQDLQYSSKETRIVLGAAVFDDVMGLIVLGVLAAVISGGPVTVGVVAVMVGKSLGFLVASILFGFIAAPALGRALSRLHAGDGMKMALALVFCVSYAWIATLVGLAGIVGAFAAGLVLDAVHFKHFRAPVMVEMLRGWANALDNNQQEVRDEMLARASKEEHAHVEELIEGPARFLVPIFFVLTGMQVDIMVFADLNVVGIALVLSVIAFIGKYAAGFVAGPGTNKHLIGVGMVPRGEVGLIFANIGKQMGVLNDATFAIAVVVVIITTLVAPMILGPMIKKEKAKTSRDNALSATTQAAE